MSRVSQSEISPETNLLVLVIQVITVVPAINPLFNSSLHFKSGQKRHNSNILNINILPF